MSGVSVAFHELDGRFAYAETDTNGIATYDQGPVEAQTAFIGPDKSPSGVTTIDSVVGGDPGDVVDVLVLDDPRPRVSLQAKIDGRDAGADAAAELYEALFCGDAMQLYPDGSTATASAPRWCVSKDGNLDVLFRARANGATTAYAVGTASSVDQSTFTVAVGTSDWRAAESRSFVLQGPTRAEALGVQADGAFVRNGLAYGGGAFEQDSGTAPFMSPPFYFPPAGFATSFASRVSVLGDESVLAAKSAVRFLRSQPTPVGDFAENLAPGLPFFEYFGASFVRPDQPVISGVLTHAATDKVAGIVVHLSGEDAAKGRYEWTFRIRGDEYLLLPWLPAAFASRLPPGMEWKDAHVRFVRSEQIENYNQFRKIPPSTYDMTPGAPPPVDGAYLIYTSEATWP
jgi:hypothetical protein